MLAACHAEIKNFKARTLVRTPILQRMGGWAAVNCEEVYSTVQSFRRLFSVFTYDSTYVHMFQTYHYEVGKDKDDSLCSSRSLSK